jgi:hypothetical protein
MKSALGEERAREVKRRMQAAARLEIISHGYAA